MFIPLTPLRCLERAVNLYGHKEAAISGTARYTYAQFGKRCGRLAAALRAKGMEGRERVAYLSYNTIPLLEGYFGVPRSGGIFLPLNARMTVHEISAILRHSLPSVLLFEDAFAPCIDELRAACPSLRAAISLGDDYETLLAGTEGFHEDLGHLAENAVCELFYTSGSTGDPKGVMLSHRTLYLHALTAADVFELDDTSVVLYTIPLFHANGWGVPHASTMVGAKQVLLRRFDPANVCRLIESERVTTIFLVPSMAQALLSFLQMSEYDFSSLRLVHLGGAPCATDLLTRLEEALQCECRAGYGLTETGPLLTNARPKSTFAPSATVELRAMAGWPVPGMEVRVVDAELRDVPRDSHTVGEVIARGDHVMDGYFRDDCGTVEAMAGGWFHTGDLAVWDGESYLQIVDRKKDVIISGGENVSSCEVEAALSSHPAVAECAVVSAPDPKWGEMPVAIVFARPGSEVGEAELIAHLEPLIARFKIPRRFEFVSEPLPRTGTGKVLKRELREPFWQGRELRVQG